MIKPQIILYGAPWCGDCKRSISYFKQKGIKFRYVDIDKDKKAAQKVIEINDGMRSIPTIIFPDQTVLVEPSNRELKEALDKHGFSS